MYHKKRSTHIYYESPHDRDHKWADSILKPGPKPKTRSNMQRIVLLRSCCNHLTQSSGLFISIIYMATLPLFMESKEKEDEREKGKEKDTTLLLQRLKKKNLNVPSPVATPLVQTWRA